MREPSSAAAIASRARMIFGQSMAAGALLMAKTPSSSRRAGVLVAMWATVWRSPGDEAEAGVLLGANAFGVGERRDLRTDEVADQLAARSRIGSFVQAADVGHRGEASVARDGQPAAAGAQVAATGDVEIVVPDVQCARGTVVELVAIGGDDDRIARRGVNGDGDE